MSIGPNLKICHLADVHLGYRRYNKVDPHGFNQRESDVGMAFKEAVDRIIAIGPDITIIAGDLFHTVRPSNAVIAFAFRELRRLVQETSAPLVIIAGNHETPRKSDTGCILRLFGEIENVHCVFQRAERLSFRDIGLSLLCLPHAELTPIDTNLLRADDKMAHNVLAIHAQVGEKWISDFGGVELSLSSLKPHEWDYIALGHVHFYNEIAKNAAYSGSLEHTSSNIWAEANKNKGFLEVSLPDGKRVFHALTTPRVIVDVPPFDVRGLDGKEIMRVLEERIEGISGGIEGKIVRLSIRNIGRETFRQLDHKLIRNWRTRALNMTLEFYPPEDSAYRGLSSSVARTGLRQEFVNFVNDWQAQEASLPEIRQLIMDYWEKTELEVSVGQVTTDEAA